jgi:hypothetical protein
MSGRSDFNVTQSNGVQESHQIPRSWLIEIKERNQRSVNVRYSSVYLAAWELNWIFNLQGLCFRGVAAALLSSSAKGT